MAERMIYAWGTQKDLLGTSMTPLTPLQCYLHEDWQNMDPTNLIYFVGAASSGGYRAFMSDKKPSGRQHGRIIRMNTKLIMDVVNDATLPEELHGKDIIVPHNIGVGVPIVLGTMVGINEAHINMLWMMRLAGVSENTAREFCTAMTDEHSNIIKRIGNTGIAKSEKKDDYIKLIQIFLDTIKRSGDPIRPLSAMALGFDWASSLGSRLEAALGHHFNIPMYEVRLDKNHPDYQRFIAKYHLGRILPCIHLATIEGDKSSLVRVQPMEQIALERVLGDTLKFN